MWDYIIIQVQKLENIRCNGKINYEYIIHDSVRFVLNNTIQGQWNGSVLKVKRAIYFIQRNDSRNMNTTKVVR